MKFEKSKSEKPLSDLYSQYNAENLPKSDFVGRLFQYLLDNYERYHIFEGNRDRWNEFVSWLYPRLSRAVDVYREQGSSFDAYITGIVHNAAKEYRCREADHYMTEYICWQARSEELALCEGETEYYEYPKNITIPADIKPRQILLLLLKSYYFVSDEMVKRAAPLVGIDAEVICGMIEKLRARRAEREAAILEFRERLYSQHYRCLAYQERMYAALPGTDYHKKMRDRFDRARIRFRTMRKRLTGMRVDASNRMIAEVMGIPKGTVDSCLSAVKNRMMSIQTTQRKNRIQ